MSQPPPLIAGIGEVLWDKFPDGDRLGGAPANFAFHAAQLGANSRVISRTGRDPDGDRLREQLRRLGLLIDFLQSDPVNPTGTVLVQIDNGQPTYTITQSVAWDFLEPTEQLQNLVLQLDAICFGTLAQRNPVSRDTIRRVVSGCRADALRLFDINFRQTFYTPGDIEFGLSHATALKLNADELVVMGRIYGCESDILGKLFQRFPLDLIAVTRGAEGCALYGRGQTVRSPGTPIQCVDAVGAGDAFSAMLAVGLLKNLPLQEIADRCNRIGAFVASQPGAMPQLPVAMRCF